MCHRERALEAAVLVVDSELRHKFGEWLLDVISRAGECNLTIRRGIRHVGAFFRWLSVLSSVILHWDGKASRAGVVKQLPIAKFERSMRLLVPDSALRPSEAQSSLDAATGRAKYCRSTVLFLWYRLTAGTMKCD
uniref:Uncharacterized protein n=1 Tax=Hyaloperonospora arabidopsidis (strain Emoy2) TaxID=559515 RepID=M4BA71_HYAAE